MGDDDEKKYMAGCCCFVILAISGGLVGCSFKTLEYNQVGIDFDSTSQSINEDKLFHNGRHFIGLAHSFFVYPTKLLTVEFAERDDIGNPDGQSGPLSAGSKDGQAIEIEISFFIRLRTKEVSNVVNLYKEYRTTFMPTVISKATNAIKETTVKFVTLEFFTNRTDISAEIHRALSGALESMSMDVEAVQLRNIKLSDNFEEAIIDKIVSAQADKPSPLNPNPNPNPHPHPHPTPISTPNPNPNPNPNPDPNQADKTANENGLALQVEADTAVIVQQSDTNIAVIKASADSEAVVTTGAASAHADAPMHQCTNAPMHQHKCTNAPMHRYTNAPIPLPLPLPYRYPYPYPYPYP